MIRVGIVFAFLLSVLGAYEINTIDSEKFDKALLKQYKENFFLAHQQARITDEELVSALKRAYVFASAYVDGLDESEHRGLTLYINDYLAKQYIDKYLASLDIDEEEKVLRSYYELHKKEKYKNPPMLDIALVNFGSKERALEFYKSLSKDIKAYDDVGSYGGDVKYYKQVLQSALNETYRLFFDTKKSVHGVVSFEEGVYSVVLFLNIRDAGFFTFEEVRSSIKSYLIEQKRDSYLDSKYKKILKERESR